MQTNQFIKIIICDGCIECVMADPETAQSDINLEIVDYDRNRDSEEEYNRNWEKDYTGEFQYMPYKITHPGNDDE